MTQEKEKSDKTCLKQQQEGQSRTLRCILYVITVACLMSCIVFLFCVYLQIERRLAAIDNKMGALERRPETSSPINQTTNPVGEKDKDNSLNVREKRVAAISIGSLEKRLRALEIEARALKVNKSRGEMRTREYCRGRDGRDGRDGPQGPPGRDGREGRKGPIGTQGQPGQKGEIGQIGSTGTQGPPGDKGQEGRGLSGVKYVRWGRTTCSSGAQVVYTGVVGTGFHSHTGGGGQYICLPNNPQFDRYDDAWQATGTVHATEYEVSSFSPFKGNLNNMDAPCVVCYVMSRGSQLMIPARNDCPSGWTEEYHGYLMTEHYSHKSTRDFLCVDGEAEPVPFSHADKNAGKLYLVQSHCSYGLACPPYVHGRELTCAVCTK